MNTWRQIPNHSLVAAISLSGFRGRSVGEHLQQLLDRLLCPWFGKHEFEPHALSGPHIHDARKSLKATLVQHKNNVHLGEAFQFQSDFCHDVTSGLADIPNLAAKQVSGNVIEDLGESSARETTALSALPAFGAFFI